MVRKDGAAIRSQRIQEMAEIIHRHLERDPDNPYVRLSKTLAQFQVDYGLTREKIMEYLRILEELQHFTIDEQADKIRKNASDD